MAQQVFVAEFVRILLSVPRNPGEFRYQSLERDLSNSKPPLAQSLDRVPDFPARAGPSSTREFESFHRALRKLAATSSKQVHNGKDFRRPVAFVICEDYFSLSSLARPLL
jgi:hypothetical protein